MTGTYTVVKINKAFAASSDWENADITLDIKNDYFTPADQKQLLDNEFKFAIGFFNYYTQLPYYDPKYIKVRTYIDQRDNLQKESESKDYATHACNDDDFA